MTAVAGVKETKLKCLAIVPNIPSNVTVWLCVYLCCVYWLVVVLCFLCVCVCHYWFVHMRKWVLISLDCVLSTKKSCVKSTGCSARITHNIMYSISDLPSFPSKTWQLVWGIYTHKSLNFILSIQLNHLYLFRDISYFPNVSYHVCTVNSIQEQEVKYNTVIIAINN